MSEVKQLRQEIRRLKPDQPEFAARFAEANQQLGDIIASDAQGRASTAQQSAEASAIKASKSQRGIQLRITSGSGTPFAIAAFFGMDRHTGWYARERYADSAGKQFLPWVGSDWEPGGGGGPYAINPAIASHLDEVMEQWGQVVEQLLDEIDTK